MSTVEMNVNGVEVMYHDLLDKYDDHVIEVRDILAEVDRNLQRSKYGDNKLDTIIDGLHRSQVNLERIYLALLALKEFDKMLNGGDQEEEISMEKLESLCEESN